METVFEFIHMLSEHLANSSVFNLDPSEKFDETFYVAVLQEKS